MSHIYSQAYNISRTLVGNKIVIHSGVVGASPVGAAPTTSSFSTYTRFNGLVKDNNKTRRETFKCSDLVHLILEVWRYSHIGVHIHIQIHMSYMMISQADYQWHHWKRAVLVCIYNTVTLHVTNLCYIYYHTHIVIHYIHYILPHTYILSQISLRMHYISTTGHHCVGYTSKLRK